MYEDRTDEQIKQEMLNNVKNTVDKSENSFIHDAIAPSSIEFARVYMELEYIVGKLDVENLFGEELERYVYQRAGIKRKPATKATATVMITGREGAIISKGDLVGTDTVNFISMEEKSIEHTGQMTVLVECEEYGTVGNVPSDTIKNFPVSIVGLTSVTNLEPVTNGYDAESDESLLKRYYEHIRTPATGGNKHHYRNWAKEVTGVGDARVIPLWNGNGTVKVVIIDSNKKPVTEDLIAKVSEYIEAKRPLGARVTVASAIPKKVNINLLVVKDGMFTPEQVMSNIRLNVTKYFEKIAFDTDFISYAWMGKIILETEGVLDYSNLTINDTTENITLKYEEVPILGEVGLDG